jgi:hypothetical protein
VRSVMFRSTMARRRSRLPLIHRRVPDQTHELSEYACISTHGYRWRSHPQSPSPALASAAAMTIVP